MSENNNNPDTGTDYNGIEGGTSPSVGRTSFTPFIIAVVIAATIFTLDLISPLGVAGGVLYMLLVLFGWWFQERSAIFFLAVAGSILTFLGYFLSPEGGIDWVILTNRAYAVVVIWATAAALWWAWRERSYRHHLSAEEQRHGKKTILAMGRENILSSVLIILITVFSWEVVSRIEEQEKVDIAKFLKTALETSHISIRNQLNDQKKVTKVWAENVLIRMAAMELAVMSRNSEALINSPAQRNLRVWIKSLLKTVGYNGFFIIGKDNINLASSRDENIGVINLLTHQGDFLDRVRGGETLISLPQLSDVPLKDTSGEMIEQLATMFVATPIRDYRGKIVAVLAFRLDPDEKFTSVFASSRFGDSGDTYAFDRQGLLISESRFNDQLRRVGLITGKYSGLNIEIRDPGVNMVLGQKPALARDRQPLTRMAQSAMVGENGSNLDGYRDYRGVPVVGAWLWDGDLGLGIATEIDVAEVYASFKNMRFFLITFSALSIGTLMVLTIASSRSRKRIALSEKKFRDVADVASDWFWETGPDFRYTFVSDRFYEVTHFKPTDIIGKTRIEFVGSELIRKNPDMWRSHEDDLKNHRSFRDLEYAQKNASNALQYVRVSAKPVFDGDGIFLGYRGAATDITKRKRAENELAIKVKELDFQKFALDEHAIVSISDIEGDITYVNDKFCEASGYSCEELMGRNHRFMKSGEHSERFFSDLWQTITNGKVWNGEIKNRKKDGTYYWVKSTIVPFPDEHGRPFQYVCIRTDITDRKEAEQNLQVISERFTTSQNIANIGTWDWDIETGNRYWSERVAPLYGYQNHPMEIVIEDVMNLIHPDDRDTVADAIKTCLEENADYNIEFRILWPDGSVHWVRERGDVIRNENGKPVRMLGVVIDIDAMKETEKELGRAKAEADKANQAKSEFLSSMSHELRTPLNAILGFAQLLESNRKTPPTEQQTLHIHQILKGGEHLLELIDEILDLSMIEAGKLALSIEAINTRQAIDESLSFIETLAENRGIIVEDRTGKNLPAIQVDSLRYRQVILNLLSNAVKYNHEGGTVWLDAEQRQDRILRLSVSDTGPGIPEEKQPELFQPFNRLGADNTEIEGFGIGLVLTKKLVEGMGGAIGYKSTLGTGSVFWVEFPIVDGGDVVNSPERQDAPVAGLNIESVNRILLYVEDNLANLALMEDIVLDIPNLTMISTHTAELGLALAEERKPDVIILDVNLPEMDGIAAVKLLKKSPTTKDIPVLALSADAMPHVVEKGYQAGFMEYLTKPVKIPRILKAIQDALNNAT